MMSAAKAKFKVENLNELPQAWVAVISRHISLSKFTEICCYTTDQDSIAEFPSLYYQKIDGQPYDDRDELAGMCWCLLALDESLGRKAASLRKAIYIMNSAHFRYSWNATHRTKERFWRLHAAAAPFVYIERRQSSLDLDLNPQESGLLHKVEDLVSNHEEVKTLIQKARTVTERLTYLLDYRALQQVKFVPFPREIAPAGIEMPKLTDKIITSLKGYRSAER